MASELDWVEDVRRWYRAGRQDRPVEGSVLAGGAPLEASADAVGYEAANPALQAQNWPDAPALRAEL